MYGVNISSTVKNKPYITKFYQKRQLYRPFGTIKTSEVITDLKQNKISIIRQLIILDEVVDDEDNLRVDYLNDFAKVSKELLDAGFKVILDFHEDIYCRQLGGCGLSNKYLPDDLKEYVKQVDKGGEDWGATPVNSEKQRRCWQHFYKNMRHVYAADITRICKFLQNALEKYGSKRYYDYVDIINEPGHPSLYKIRFYFGKSKKYGEMLCDLYRQTILALEDTLKNPNLRYIIEPFNYDVSQIGQKCFGLPKLQLPTELLKRVTFGPHIYTPLHCTVQQPAEKILLNNLYTMRTLGISDIIIGEFGDLTNGQDTSRFEQQIRLLQRLGLPMCAWEYDVCYDSSTYIYEQDMYAWNMENMSMSSAPGKATKTGKVYYKYTCYGVERELYAEDSLKSSEFGVLNGIKIRFPRSKHEETLYRYVYKLKDGAQLLKARIYSLKHGVHILPVGDGFMMASAKLKAHSLASKPMCFIQYAGERCVLREYA